MDTTTVAITATATFCLIAFVVWLRKQFKALWQLMQMRAEGAALEKLNRLNEKLDDSEAAKEELLAENAELKAEGIVLRANIDRVQKNYTESVDNSARLTELVEAENAGLKTENDALRVGIDSVQRKYSEVVNTIDSQAAIAVENRKEFTAAKELLAAACTARNSLQASISRFQPRWQFSELTTDPLEWTRWIDYTPKQPYAILDDNKVSGICYRKWRRLSEDGTVEAMAELAELAALVRDCEQQLDAVKATRDSRAHDISPAQALDLQAVLGAATAAGVDLLTAARETAESLKCHNKMSITDQIAQSVRVMLPSPLEGGDVLPDLVSRPPREAPPPVSLDVLDVITFVAPAKPLPVSPNSNSTAYYRLADAKKIPRPRQHRVALPWNVLTSFFLEHPKTPFNSVQLAAATTMTMHKLRHALSVLCRCGFIEKQKTVYAITPAGMRHVFNLKERQAYGYADFLMAWKENGAAPNMPTGLRSFCRVEVKCAIAQLERRGYVTKTYPDGAYVSRRQPAIPLKHCGHVEICAHDLNARGRKLVVGDATHVDRLVARWQALPKGWRTVTQLVAEIGGEKSRVKSTVQWLFKRGYVTKVRLSELTQRTTTDRVQAAVNKVTAPSQRSGTR